MPGQAEIPAEARGGTKGSREFHMSEADYRFIASSIQKRVGIVLGESKRDMVYGRLARRLRVLGLSTFEEYCEKLRGPDGEAEVVEAVNSLTTNLTKFFRESHHFDDLARDVLRRADEPSHSRNRRIRIWSAGCSSGQEPFSIAMTAAEALGESGLGDVRILATDIDENMLRRCRSGSYSDEQLGGLSGGRKKRFLSGDPERAGHAVFSNELRSIIKFNKLNLLDQWPMKGPFDAIFCRNVVIYFDQDTQRSIFTRMAQLLAPGGRLFIGHAENLRSTPGLFEGCGRTVYRLKSGG